MLFLKLNPNDFQKFSRLSQGVNFCDYRGSQRRENLVLEMTEWGWSEMSFFSLPHPATGVKAIQTTLLFRAAACWGRGGGAGGGGKEADHTLDLLKCAGYY